MASVLVVEDNERLRMLMAISLRHAGYAVLEAGNGEEALTVLAAAPVSIILLDILMPVMDGFCFLGALQQLDNDIPTLVITASETAEDRRKALALGASDYMVKPVQMEDLILRIDALLHRACMVHSNVITVGAVTLNRDSMTADCGGTTTELPQKEFVLLQLLLSHPEKIFTRRALMHETYGSDNDLAPETVDAHIHSLQAKFDAAESFAIEAVIGLGYRALLK